MRSRYGFPIPTGILLGLGLGGFFDGILFHQVLQWHHMLSSWYALITSLENFKINTLWGEYFTAQHTSYRARFPNEAESLSLGDAAAN
jgi:uncharacterized membrane protein